ncbi:MAG: MATE family efflux transporter [Bacteroidales bacterium]|nr:MATE family efflux transporter [Bacteroidales bacterium]
MKLYYPKEYKTILKLGFPITIGELGFTVQGLADNVMVGHHSTNELAAAGFVNNFFLLTLLLTIGFAAGAISRMGALFSRGESRELVSVLKSSIVACVNQGLLVTSLLAVLYFCIPLMGQPEELLPLMKPYLLIQLASMPFIFLANPFKIFYECINETSVPMYVTMAGTIWNVFLNWVLIFGNLGFPELGLVGAGWATFSARLLMFILYSSVLLFSGKYRQYRELWKGTSLKRSEVRGLTKLGWPVAVQSAIEVASFTLVVVFIGWMGASHLAAHQVMCSLSNVVFMAFLGFSNAVAIRVSNHNGLGDMKAVREAAFAGYEIVLLISMVASTLVFLFRFRLADIFTDSAEVSEIVALCVNALVLYQVGDGIQCTFCNALRGLGDVDVLIKYSFISYVLISIPLSYLFGIVLGLGTFGVWLGFPFGLSSAALFYLLRFLRHTRTPA